jgi:hypothetical protein
MTPFADHSLQCYWIEGSDERGRCAVCGTPRTGLLEVDARVLPAFRRQGESSAIGCRIVGRNLVRSAQLAPSPSIAS